MNHSAARTVALLTGDALVLLTVRPRWRLVASGLARPRSWLDTVGADAALAAACAALLWLAAAWLAVGLLAGVGTRLPGLAGRACARITRVVVPTVLVRVVLGSTTLGLLAAPVAHAVTPSASPPVSSVVGARLAMDGSAALLPRTGVGVPPPTWPATPSVSTTIAPPTWPSSTAPSTPAPSSTAPSSAPSTPAPSSTAPSSTQSNVPTRVPAPAPPTSNRTPSTPIPAATPSNPRTRAAAARVHRGDSLWLLAARRLGPHADAGDLARYWPQIYAANRGVIGDNPSVIHPGQVLDLPVPTQEPS